MPLSDKMPKLTTSYSGKFIQNEFDHTAASLDGGRLNAKQIRESYQSNDFLSRQQKNSDQQDFHNADKYLEMARKPLTLTEKDDMQILNSFINASDDSNDTSGLRVNITSISEQGETELKVTVKKSHELMQSSGQETRLRGAKRLTIMQQHSKNVSSRTGGKIVVPTT